MANRTVKDAHSVKGTKRTSYKHYKLVFCHKTLHIHANPRETKSGRGEGERNARHMIISAPD
jgi:hypothetical protein